MPYHPTCNRPIPRSTLEGGAAVFLLTVEYAGATLRYSSKACEVPSSATGLTLPWRGMLPSMQVSEAIDVLSQEPQAPKISIAVPVVEPIAQWVAWGHRVDRARGELAWWVEGTTWESRQVLVSGPLRGATVPALGEPWSFTLEPEQPGAGGRILKPRREVSRDTAGGTVAVEEEGKAYPMVFGGPGAEVQRKSFLTRRHAGSPARIWTESTPGTVTHVLLCEGHASQSGPVRLLRRGCADPADDGFSDIERAFTLTADDLGHPITILDVSTLSAAQRTARQWWVSWRRAAGALSVQSTRRQRHSYSFAYTDAPITDFVLARFEAGDVVSTRTIDVTQDFDGVSNEIKYLDSNNNAFEYVSSGDVDETTIATYTVAESTPIDLTGYVQLTVAASGATQGTATVSVIIERQSSRHTLGELLMWLLTRSNRRVPYGEWQGVANLLTSPVAGYIDAEVSPWEYLLNEVLPLCPVSLRYGPSGVHPVLWRWWATADDALWDLEHGVDGVVRLPDMRSARADAETNTEAVFEYGWDPEAQIYRLTQEMKSEPEGVGAGLVSSASDSGGGATELGVQAYGARTLPIQSRIVYKRRTADWVMRWKLAAEGWAHRLVTVECRQSAGHLQVGDVVTYTDADLAITSAVALVQGRELTDGGRIRLQLVLVDGLSSTSTGPNSNDGPGDRTGKPDPQA